MNFEQARTNMIKQQLHTWGVIDAHVLHLFETLPRENFLPQEYRVLAYSDLNIPIGYDQTTLSPKEEARIIQALDVKPSDKTLLIGTHDGYMTGLLAKLSNHVYSIDSIEAFTEHARKVLEELNINNVSLMTTSVSKGWQEAAPYDVILCTGSLPVLPTELQQQLDLGGRMIAFVGKAPAMEAMRVKRTAQDIWQIDRLFETVRPRLPLVEEPNLFKF